MDVRIRTTLPSPLEAPLLFSQPTGVTGDEGVLLWRDTTQLERRGPAYVAEMTLTAPDLNGGQRQLTYLVKVKAPAVPGELIALPSSAVFSVSETDVGGEPLRQAGSRQSAKR